MKLTVKEVNPIEQKSVQEVEKNLLEKHEQSLNNESLVENEPLKTEGPLKTEETLKTEEPVEIKDEDVLSYIKNRYKDKEISSIDDLFTQREMNQELPEDVSKYLNFKKETGRGFSDFVKANKNYNELEDDQVLAEYYSLTEAEIYYLNELKRIKRKYLC